VSYQDLVKDLEKLKNPIRAKLESRYFKTGKGEYGEGDIFWGIKTADMRRVAKKYADLPFSDLHKLLASPIHVFRSVALVVLVNRYQKSKEQKIKKEIAEFYLDNRKGINNWDLVDISAPKILGEWLCEDRDRERDRVLDKFAKSKDLWERRIAIMATFAFIKRNQFADSLKLAEILLNDEHDLIHKAVGWMLREIGKRDLTVEEKFLDKYAEVMPRTMLRYALEKFSPSARQRYLAK